MATYRIVDMYRKSKAVKGIHYDSQDNPILAYRVDKRHSLLFGLIHYWDYGAYNLCPEYLFSSVDKAKDAILKVDKSRRVTILYKQRMKVRLAKKIMKQARHLSTASDYWYRRLRDFEYKICYGFVGKKDHRIIKAISLTSKKK